MSGEGEGGRSWKGMEYKDLQLVSGTDRKICPEGNCLASLGSAKNCLTLT